MSTALFIIDVQNDFTEGGALSVVGGNKVASGITEMLAQRAGDYDAIFASRDWHDGDNSNGGHFAVEDEPDFVDTWPQHCIAGSHGAEYHPDLDISAVTFHIRKGQGKPAYSIFEGVTESGETVHELLTARGITSIDLVGLATDHCVKASAFDALAHGQHVRLLVDLMAGVDPVSSVAAVVELAHAGAEIVESDAAPTAQQTDEAAPAAPHHESPEPGTGH